jgi:hypothetical protein
MPGNRRSISTTSAGVVAIAASKASADSYSATTRMSACELSSATKPMRNVG